jgi:hypothetical protein
MKRSTLVALSAIVLFLASTLTCLRAEPQTVPDDIVKNMLSGIETLNVDKFAEKGDPEFKARVNRDILIKVNSQLAPKLKGGYTIEYLGILRQIGTVTYLYKITFKDGSDDILVKLQLRKNFVSGFLLE